jgi:hypothetical protein
MLPLPSAIASLMSSIFQLNIIFKTGLFLLKGNRGKGTGNNKNYRFYPFPAQNL